MENLLELSVHHPLLSLSIILMGGLIGGELVSRLHMPRVTGWIVTGIALGALNLPQLELTTLKSFWPLTDFVLGYIAFSVGSHLNFSHLRNAGKRLFFLLATEATITPAIVASAMYFIGGFPIEVALVFAAVAVAQAPGTTMLVVRESRSRGVFTKTLIAAVALIDMVAVMLFVIVDAELGSADARITGPEFLITSLPYAFKTLAIAAAIGVATALLVIGVARYVVGRKLLGASMVAAIVISWGVADALDVSPILAATFVGVALANMIDDEERVGQSYIDTFSDVLFTAFYTLAGLRLNFSMVVPLFGMVALFFGARMIGKVTSVFTSMSLAGAVKSLRNYMGLALLPHGGVAVGLLFFTQNMPALAGHADSILAIGLAALAINQLVGPSVTRFTLKWSEEAGKEKPRLLDFLREQDITCDFKPKNREEAIRKLADLLYATHEVPIDKEEYVARVLERDREMNTCLGEGLMVPHAALNDEAADDVVGVMGLNREGLDWETPDGKPVHAIVLLATASRQRHLEVLAAFARAIGGDRSIRDQLYHAPSPAHAYHVLHSDDAHHFNYYIEDQLDAADSASFEAS